MHIDRTRFLLLSAALAAGCGARQRPESTAVSRGPDFDTTQGSSAPPRPVATSQIASDELVTPPPVDPVIVGPSAEGVPVGGDEPIGVSDAVDPRLARICEALRRPGPVCESFAQTTSACYRYGRVLEPKAAEAAAKCLASRSNTQRICEFGVDAKCATEGTRGALLAPGAAQSCTNLMPLCRGTALTQSSCQAALSGYKLSVQVALVSCITESCDVGACFYQVGN